MIAASPAITFAGTRTQTFDTDPTAPGGTWLREGWQNGDGTIPNGDIANFGFSDGVNPVAPGGTLTFGEKTPIPPNGPNPPTGLATGLGEAGGHITTTGAATYGDQVGTFTLDDRISFSGVFEVDTANQDSVIGFYNSAAIANLKANPPAASGFVPQNLGIETTGRGTVEPVSGLNTQNIRLHLGGAGLNTAPAQTRSTRFSGDDTTLGQNRVLTTKAYAITFVYDPNGGVNGQGRITVTIPGVTSSQGGNTGFTDLTAAMRTSGVTFDRFGLMPNLVRTGSSGENVFIDDMTYTIAPPQWNVDASGTWSTAGNWSGGVPNAAGDEAKFTSAINAPRTVSVDGTHTVGAVLFDNANKYTLAAAGGGGTLVLDSDTFGSVTVNSGSHDITVPVVLNKSTGFRVTPATSTLTVPNLTNTGVTVAKSGAGTLVLSRVRGSGLNVQEGLLQMLPDGTNNGTSVASNLTVGSSGKLDINNNKLITQSAIGSFVATSNTYSGVTGLIATGRNGGGWTGTSGIVTSQSTATSGNLTSIGVATAGQVKGIADAATATWGGQTVTGTDTLVMYTYGGDANLDGKINVDDYGRIDSSIPLGLTGWYNGDFNYDGKINVDDYGIIDSNIGIQGAPFPTGGGAGLSAVPEPASILSLSVIGLSSLLRTRRQRR